MAIDKRFNVKDFTSLYFDEESVTAFQHQIRLSNTRHKVSNLGSVL